MPGKRLLGVGALGLAIALACAGTGAGGSAPPLVPHRSLGALDSSLAQVVEALHGGGVAAALASADAQGIEVAQRKVRVLVLAKPGGASDARAALTAAGAVVEHAVGDRIEALVAPAALPRLAASQAVAEVREPVVAVTTALGEGVALTGVDFLHDAGIDGTGVKVAVIDAGFQGLTTVFGAPLPAWISTYNYCGGSVTAAPDGAGEHGVAVAEIVHQMAPGARLVLMCVTTELDLAAAEAQAESLGVKVINHSVSWFGTGSPGDGTGEPGTPDAVVAKARAAGILWVNSAGNAASSHWSGNFMPSAVDPNLNAFDGGHVFDDVVVGSGKEVCIELTWNDWPVTTDDFDWLLVRRDTHEVVASSMNDQSSGPRAPVESDCYTNDTGAPRTLGIVISRYSAVGGGRLDLFVFFAGPLAIATPTGSVLQPATSPAALAVGATCWDRAFGPEEYSSRGPTVDGRWKPELLAPDATSTQTYGDSTGCLSGFAGTSAAAPHVAGAAAALLEHDPSLTPASLQALLESSAVPIDSIPGLLAVPPIGRGARLAAVRSAAYGQVPTELLTLNRTGTGVRTVLGGSYELRSPTWSPDGTKIAFVRGMHVVQDGSQIWVIDADGSNLRRLSAASATHDAAPAWSPDGTTIAYECQPDICVMDATTGSLVGEPTAADGIPDRSPAWSPDGTQMVWQHGDAIWKMNADAMRSTQLTSGVAGAPDTSPQWSGNKIVFVSHRNGPAGEIWVMNADGSGQAPVPGAIGASPVWSGSAIAWLAGTLRIAPASGAAAVSQLAPALEEIAAQHPWSGPAAVEAPSPSPDALPRISGRATYAGGTLVVDPGRWRGTDPLRFEVQWEWCNVGGGCQAISGATDTAYRIRPSDAPGAIRALVTVTNSAGTAAAPTPIALVSDALPVTTGMPSIDGTAQVGKTLTVASVGPWNGATAFAYRWRRCGADGGACSDVGGLGSTTYVPTSADVGSTIRVAVFGSNGSGSDWSTSLPSAVVTAASAAPPAPTPPPPSSGGSAGVAVAEAEAEAAAAGSHPTCTSP